MFITESQHQEWEKVTPNNGYVFAQMMQKKSICTGVLETFLQVKIDHIEYINTEETIKENFFSKGIRLDVYVQDEFDSIYNVEMQRRNLHDLPKRSRYYQSLIDLNSLETSIDYDALCKSFVIFICNFDPFGPNRSVYNFENRDAVDPDLKLGDGTVKLFFNTRGKDKDQIDPRLRLILEFFEDKLPENTSDDPLLQDMIDEFYRIKANREMEVGFMTQAVYEQDLKKMGYMDGYDFAKLEDAPIIKEKDDRIERLETMLKEALAKIDAFNAAK